MAKATVNINYVVNQENRTHDLEVNKFKTHTDVPDVEI